jgi:hypothetical protein
LKSFEIREKLRDLHAKNDPFWQELTQVSSRHQAPVVGPVVFEDMIEEVDEEEMDDSDVSLQKVIEATHRDHVPERTAIRETGGLMVQAEAEDLDIVPEPLEEGKDELGEGEGAGRVKRKRTANRLYKLADFKRHWDEEASDIE